MIFKDISRFGMELNPRPTVLVRAEPEKRNRSSPLETRRPGLSPKCQTQRFDTVGLCFYFDLVLTVLWSFALRTNI